MDSLKQERKLLLFTYLLCIVCFVNLGLLKQPFDMGAMIIAVVTCVLMAYSHFVIRRFFPDGDKYMLVFIFILSVIGIVMLYRIDILNDKLFKDDLSSFLNNNKNNKEVIQIIKVNLPKGNIDQVISDDSSDILTKLNENYTSIQVYNTLSKNVKDTDLKNKLKKFTLPTQNAIKQVIWFSVGIAGYIILVVLIPDLKRFRKYKYLYLACTIIFMAMGTFFGTEIGGSKNWIIIHGFSFQPSEFGKVFFVGYLGASLMKYENFKDLFEPAIVVMMSLGFMVLQKDLGSALILFGISVTMLYIATSKLKYAVTCFGLFAVGSVISYNIFDHVQRRVLIWKNPWPYANDKSYQIVQSMLSIASGGLFGTGLGLGHPEYVPVNSTDFIYAIICEELGILMGLGIIILFFLLFYRCMRAAVYVQDKFSRLLAVGYSAMIASQALVIIGGVTNMIPLTGITLPLVSYGGSSMLMTFFSLGIIQKISEEG